MNIFVLSSDPRRAARYLCNKHVCKMLLESAQLLCNSNQQELVPYKHTHKNHPCSVWARQSLQNYHWLCEHAQEQCSEYTRRYGKRHASQSVIEFCSSLKPDIPSIGLQRFVVAIRDVIWHGADPITSYRAYYVAEKSRFAKWAPRASPPLWWPFKDPRGDLLELI